MTLPERMLWNRLKKKQLSGLRFRRQHPLGPYIVDFYCHDAAMAVEVDGGSHQGDQRDHDFRRDRWMVERGVAVLRVRAVDVLREMEAVLRTIEREASERFADAAETPPQSAKADSSPVRTGERRPRGPS